MTAATREGRRLGGREATAARIEGAYALAVGMPDKPAPSGWEWRLLTDVARLESGHTPSRKRPDYWGGDIPWIGIRDATGNHGSTLLATNENTNELGIANSAARVLPANTVCLSRTASVGYVVVMGRPMATSQDFVNWVCSDELDFRFLKYVLIAEGEALLRFASGSVHQTIYFPEVKSFYIALPPISEQRAIVDMLGALDDKIELNGRVSATLEAMAQAIFRDWFVDFGPVRRISSGLTDAAEIMGGVSSNIDGAGPPSELFPSSFDSDGIPSGWEMGPLIETLVLQRGFDLPAPSRTPGPFRVIAASGDNGAHCDFKVEAPGVCTGRSGVIGNVFYLDENFWPLNTSLWVKEFPNSTPVYAYFILKEQDLERFNSGSAVPTLNRNHVHEISIVKPPMKVVRAFDEIATAMFRKIAANQRESRTLAVTRDYLLPRLMSGRVRLGGALQETAA